MAHFRASIEGCRGEASRLGSKSSGMTARVGSWSGGVRIHLYFDEATQTDMVDVSFMQWSNGAGSSHEIYSGPVSGKTVAKRKKAA